MRKVGFYCFLSCLLSTQISFAQADFYDLNSVQKIEVFFDAPNWDYQLDTAKNKSGGYMLAKKIMVNGVSFDSVGVKYKGNSSYDSSYRKNPVHIALDEFKDQAFNGVTDIKLSNGYADPSLVREVLGYSILGNYMHCPKANFAKLYVNGKYLGLYSSAENINKEFCSDHFYSSKHTFVKCNPMVIPTVKTKSNLKYISQDSSEYFNYYELKSNTGWREVVNLCDTLSNFPTAVDKVMDVDRAIWMLAFNNLLVNLDSYSGVFSQNYYMYRDKTRHFNPIIWDLNMAFGGFPFVGSSNTSMASLSLTNMQQLSPTFHSADAYWPLIKAILANPEYKRKYVAHMKTMVKEYFANSEYKTLTAKLQNLIKADALADTNKFFSNTQFDNALSQNVAFSSYTIPGIANLMDARVTYLMALSDFSATAPTIENVKSTVANPNLNTDALITASISNATVGYLYFRFDKEMKFEKTTMYDDGLHSDGVANDGVYGASFKMSGVKAHYYIYAENANAGSFSPARAEHEFYSLTSSTETILKGEIIINELVTNNTSGATNEKDKPEDWIELYNTTDRNISLTGHHLSDSKTNIGKFTFPQNATIAAKSYKVIWADENTSTTAFVHANFKLSASGESVILSTATGEILDSVSFGTQKADVSFGRCENGDFVTIVNPTFQRVNNCATGIEDETIAQTFQINPNPASNQLFVKNLSGAQKTSEILIYNTLGELVFKTNYQESLSIDVNSWNEGLYFVRSANTTHKVLIVH